MRSVEELLKWENQPDSLLGKSVMREPEEEDGKRSMTDFMLQLSTAKEVPWEAKHNPTISLRYDKRVSFWFHMMLN